MKPEQSKPVEGLEPPQTYGMPEVLERDPDDVPVARGGERSRRRSGTTTASSYVCLSLRLGGELGRLRAGPRLLGERSLPPLLLGAHLRDLVLDGREQAVLLRDRDSIDCFCAACSATTSRLVGARLLEVRAPRLDLLAVLLDRPEDLRVLAGDALDRVEPRDDVVEARRAEEHLERGVALAVDVQVAEPLLDALLRDDEALPRGDEVLRVRREVGRRSRSSSMFA